MRSAIAFEARRCDHIVESDGTVALTIKIDPADSQAFLAASPDQGGTLFVAPGVRDLGPMEPLNLVANYGKVAMTLAESDFFGHPGTWDATGSDDDFLDWIRIQKCWLRQLPGHICAGDVVAAHVRRVARGSGVSIKPKFSALPLCDRAHSDQHQHGESVIGGRERVDRASSLFVRRWCSLTILAALNYENWFHVPPEKLRTWASDRSVFHLLPTEYRRASR
jgi:hypothetical protein